MIERSASWPSPHSFRYAITAVHSPLPRQNRHHAVPENKKILTFTPVSACPDEAARKINSGSSKVNIYLDKG
jgi:hypothetical protein